MEEETGRTEAGLQLQNLELVSAGAALINKVSQQSIRKCMEIAYKNMATNFPMASYIVNQHEY